MYSYGHSYKSSILKDSTPNTGHNENLSMISSNTKLKQLVPIILSPSDVNLGRGYCAELPARVKENKPKGDIEGMIDEITKKYLKKDEYKAGNNSLCSIGHRHNKSVIVKKKSVVNLKKKIKIKKRGSLSAVKENNFTYGCKSRKKQTVKIEYGKLLEILQRHIKVCPKLAKELDEALLV